MPLTNDQQARLVEELQAAVYNGKSADQSWSLLTEFQTITDTVPSHAQCGPGLLVKACGPAGATRVINAMKATFPEEVVQAMLNNGEDLSDPTTAAMLAAFLQAGAILQRDHDALLALATVTTTHQEPPRLYAMIHGVAGYPNAIERTDFDTAWAAAGRA